MSFAHTHDDTAVGAPAHGLAMVDPNNTVTYLLTTDYYGNDSFTYMVSDGRSGAAIGTVNITVAPQTFAAWTSSYGLSGPNALDPTCPAGDRVSNLVKSALGLNPAQPATLPTDGTKVRLPCGSWKASTCA